MKGYLRAGGDRRVAALRRFALSITVFTVLGHTVLGFEQAWAHPLSALAVAYALETGLEAVDARVRRRPPKYAGGWMALHDFLLPAHIGALAIAMLLYANQRLAPVLFAVTVAAASKHLIRVPVGGRWRHVLNPSNSGIAATLVLFPSVGISPPYHFTENLSGAADWLVPLAVLASGLVLNHRLTARTPLILAWVSGFAAQAVLRSMVLGTPLIAGLLPMTGLAFMLFTTYMITDPGTSPMAPGGQVAFGFSVAAVYSALVFAHVVFGMFFALVIVTAARGVLVGTLAAVELRRPAVAPISAGARP